MSRTVLVAESTNSRKKKILLPPTKISALIKLIYNIVIKNKHNCKAYRIFLTIAVEK